MKVRFTSEKERHPDSDQGVKVVYAPAKRVAYRLRWYLILLLVASPALWLAGNLLSDLLLIEAPAQTYQPLMEVRALESGMIRRIHVRPNQRVVEDDLLVSMDNPILSTRYRELDDGLSVVPVAPPSQEQAVQRLIDRATQRVVELERLVKLGAATRGELDQARDLRDERMSALAAIQQRAAVDIRQEQDSLRQHSERIRISQQLELLQVRAAGNATVREINVHEGEAAGPGTLIMRLYASDELQIHVFLDARQRKLAHPGQLLKLRMPDNSWLDARIVNEPVQLSRLPNTVQTPLGRNQPGLLLQVETLEPLPAKWQLD
ncbi:MAG: hypothetical protein QMB92_03925, partial [Thiopseudomonas sp.]